MAELVYGLCAVTSIFCTLLLFKGYRASRTKLLFWASLCFAGLALNNVSAVRRSDPAAANRFVCLALGRGSRGN